MRDLPWSRAERRGVHTAHRRALAHVYRAPAIRLSVRRARRAEQPLDEGSRGEAFGRGHDRACRIRWFTCPLNPRKRARDENQRLNPVMRYATYLIGRSMESGVWRMRSAAHLEGTPMSSLRTATRLAAGGVCLALATGL